MALTDPPPAPVPPPYSPSRGGSAPASTAPGGVAIAVGLVVAFVLLVGLGLGLRAVAGDRSTGDDGFHGALLAEPRDRPDFELVDTDGQPFAFSSTSGRLTILFFGYANCPDICPITLATLNEALGLVNGVSADVVFVSVDPARDTPEELRAYLNRFDTRFVGLTGTPEQLRAAQEAAGVTPAYEEGPNGRGGYDVGHSSQVIVYTPDDLAHLVYGFGVRRDEWAGDLARIRDTAEWWRR